MDGAGQRQAQGALEHQVDAQTILIGKLAEIAGSTLAHVYALEQLLEGKGIVTRAAVEARSQALGVDTTAEIELDPKYEEFRRQRDVIRRRVQEEEDESPQT
jgi:NADH:ubiquinone oxidoreductase subunit E